MLSTERWPLVVVRMPPQLSIQELESHFAKLFDAVQSKAGPFVFLTDTTSAQLSAFTARHRSCVAAHMERIHPYIAHRCVGSAFVINSATAQGILRAIRWLFPPSWPTASFACEREALQWAYRKLGAQDADELLDTLC
ncbi:MAG: hypothetical protein ACPGUV_02450 [Polyangiales bacterium]